MATFYVSRRSGLDSNAGTQAQPKQTIAAAMALVTGGAGDTIIVEGGGNVYTEAQIGTGSNAAALIGKRSVQIIGDLGTSGIAPVLEGGGTIPIGIDFPKNGNATQNTVVRNMDIRNFMATGIRANMTQGIDSNNVIEACRIHHIYDKRFFPPPGVESKYQFAIDHGGGNPRILNCELDHVGHGGESKGLYMTNCHNAMIDGLDIHHCRKDATRLAVCLNCTMQNTRTWMCTLGLYVAQSIGIRLLNNFSYLNQFGCGIKHCNDPEAALAPWGLTTGVPVHAWHNTIFHNSDQTLYIAGNLSNSLNKPTATYTMGREFMVDWQNNIFAGYGFQYLWDNPFVRDNTVFCNHNVYESRDGKRAIHLYHRIPEDNFYVETLDALAANPETLGWETNGRMMPVDFVDPDAGDLNPTTVISPTLELASPFGSQVGARNVPATGLTWKPNAAIAISSSSPSKSAQYSRLTDELGASTVIDTLTNAEEWFVLDLGSPQPFNHFRWAVFGHNKQSATQTWSFDISNTNNGTDWQRIIDHQVFNDAEGSDFIWELDATYTARYVRWYSHVNFGAWGTTTLAADHFAWGGLQTGSLLAVGTTPPPTSAAPVNSVLPVISGTAVTGQTLSVTSGTWLNNPTSFGYQWRRGPATGSNIAGATSSTYVLTAADEGQQVTCRVRATNATGFTDAFADPVTSTAPAAQTVAPANTALPAITTDGVPQVGDTVSASTGSWDNTPTAFAYQWTRNQVAISGATGQTYTLVIADDNRNIRVQVTATNSAGSATATSAPILVIPVVAPTVLPPDPVGKWGISC